MFGSWLLRKVQSNKRRNERGDKTREEEGQRRRDETRRENMRRDVDKRREGSNGDEKRDKKDIREKLNQEKWRGDEILILDLGHGKKRDQ